MVIHVLADHFEHGIAVLLDGGLVRLAEQREGIEQYRFGKKVGVGGIEP